MSVTQRIPLLFVFVALFVWALAAQRDPVEAVEIGRHNTRLLPKGKEADGIVGDFVLRNNKIEALISGSQPLRRANMTTEYAYVLQGCLYDLDLRGEANDQLTVLRPGAEGGEISYVQIVEDGSNGTAVIEAVRTAAKGDGLYTRHEYRLENDWQYILVTSTYRNEGSENKTITPPAVWKGLSTEWNVSGIRVGDSIDPFDKRGYAWGVAAGSDPLEENVELAPGQQKTYRIAVAAADSPLAAYGVVATLAGAAGEVSGSVKDPDGEAAVRASLLVTVKGETLPGYPDAGGAFKWRLPAGDYELSMEDIGREPLEQSFSVSRGGAATLDISASKASAVRIEIRDEQGRLSPAKVQFIGIEGTATPNFGTHYRVHGYDHQYQTHDGHVFQQVPPGNYLLRVTHGPEYDLAEHRIEVGKGETVDVKTRLKRSVDTSGWISTDYHSHSTPSGDNYCNTDDRIINLAAEQIEFAPTTEHNRIYDWQPHIDRLGLTSVVRTVVGIELTGSGQHFNAFPLRADALAQNGGAPVWNYDPRINALVLRHWGTPSLDQGSRYDTSANIRNKIPFFAGGPDRWVQANHPVVGTVFFDRNRDGVPDGGFEGFEDLIDAAEVWSTEILNLSPTYSRTSSDGSTRVSQNRTFGWLQMLNQGRRVWCVSVSDAHRIFGGGVGDWRTYVPSSTDEPGEIDPAEIIRNSKAGRMMITNGPFLEVTTGDGLPIGSSMISEGSVELKIRVQAPNWMEVDRVQILVNGRQPTEYNFRRNSHPKMFAEGVVRFDETVRVELQRDAHLIVVAVGENSDLSKGWGRSPTARMRPTAYTNPIFVDVDHNGFQANGDTLGHPLLVTPTD